MDERSSRSFNDLANLPPHQKKWTPHPQTHHLLQGGACNVLDCHTHEIFNCRTHTHFLIATPTPTNTRLFCRVVLAIFLLATLSERSGGAFSDFMHAVEGHVLPAPLSFPAATAKVCVCVRGCEYVYVCMYVYICMCMYTCMYIYTYVCVRVCIGVCVSVCVLCASACVCEENLHVYIHIYTYVYVYTYTYIYIYIHIYI